jgi:hypothetical protein
MLDHVVAADFNEQHIGTALAAQVAPSIASGSDGIDGVDNDMQASSKARANDLVCDGVSGGPDRLERTQSGGDDTRFDGVEPHEACRHSAGQFNYAGGLSDAGKSAEYNEHHPTVPPCLKLDSRLSTVRCQTANDRRGAALGPGGFERGPHV